MIKLFASHPFDTSNDCANDLETQIGDFCDDNDFDIIGIKTLDFKTREFSYVGGNKIEIIALIDLGERIPEQEENNDEEES